MTFANGVTDSYGVVAGGIANRAGDAAGTTLDRQAATVGGGVANVASGVNATVAGGGGNTASGDRSAIAGGSSNTASGNWAAIGGGVLNVVSGVQATVAGGIGNTASLDYAFVGAGNGNTASGVAAILPGGWVNQAGGWYSFAAGHRAKVRNAAESGDSDGDEGTFVWADRQGDFTNFESTGPNQFLISAAGGVGINTNAPGGFTLAVNGGAAKPGGGSWSVFSDARLKHAVEPLRGTLDRLLALRGVSFEYNEPEKLHELPGRRIGMLAQEVERTFPDWVGRSPEGYLHLTYRGFEALTVEALRDLRREKDTEITELRTKLAAQDAQIGELKAALAALARGAGSQR
jgi:hypothetical protein